MCDLDLDEKDKKNPQAHATQQLELHLEKGSTLNSIQISQITISIMSSVTLWVVKTIVMFPTACQTLRALGHPVLAFKSA